MLSDPVFLVDLVAADWMSCVGEAGGIAMVRYVHHELMGVCTAAAAAAVGLVVALPFRGLAHADAPGDVVAWSAGILVVVLGLSLIGERRAFRRAVPLQDPDATLPRDYAPRRHLFNGGFLAFMLVLTVTLALVANPLGALCVMPLAAQWLVNAAYALHWERTHGLLIWRGDVPGQPLGKGQMFYSSPRPPRRREDHDLRAEYH
ncbi:hypothetical protein ACFVU0_18685 [Streptomyces sp. NPDC058122]|uniref:hypothetical protein n=1 Tax=Streptomyces sp. NPDC058122 TaxID=3346349 RepID=UPI0036E2FB9B